MKFNWMDWVCVGTIAIALSGIGFSMSNQNTVALLWQIVAILSCVQVILRGQLVKIEVKSIRGLKYRKSLPTGKDLK